MLEYSAVTVPIHLRGDLLEVHELRLLFWPQVAENTSLVNILGQRQQDHGANWTKLINLRHHMTKINPQKPPKHINHNTIKYA